MSDASFFQVAEPEPHLGRTRILITEHPQVRALAGQNPWTFAIAVGLVTLQFTLAWMLADASLWLIIPAAWLVGAFVSHAAFVIVHECTHRLVFKSLAASKLTAIMCNLPMVLPTAISFGNCHLQHHLHQGDYERDVDLPYHFELKLFGSSVPGKMLWLLLLPVLLTFRPIRLKGVPLFDRWVLLNWAALIAVDAIVLATLGPKALLFLFLSFFFSIGLHPLGARWIQEHYTDNPAQETFSYYGWLNKIQLNIGFHNEHHDLPNVPWSNLPKVKQAAPELYDHLHYHTSWSRLLLEFLFAGTLSIRSRA